MTFLKDVFSSNEEEQEFLDGYAEGPFSHHRNATEEDRESEYFMQYVHYRKLHRIALRTPVGYRVTHGFAEDIWNNQLGVLLGREDYTAEINTTLVDYLESRHWYEEMENLTAFILEQGEGILLAHHEDVNKDYDQYDTEVNPNSEVLEYEAFNKVFYRIVEWDEYGEPAMYEINFPGPVGTAGAGPSVKFMRVDASRVLRFTDKQLYRRGYGYPRLAVIYDSIIILTNIIKAVGEAAFRWGTGHPLVLTKDVTDAKSLNKIKKAIGDPTRRSWHILPSEYIDRFDLVGQAGQMLNVKALADIVYDQIVIATKIPRPILLGEVAGVVQGSEVNERSYFGTLDQMHTNLEPFVRKVFQYDINIRKLLGNFTWELNWGIREVLNKLDQAKYDQIQISNTLALTSVITINEARMRLGIPPLEDIRGEVIMSLGVALQQEGGETNETTATKQKSQSTEKQKKLSKDIEKDKTVPNPAMSMKENKPAALNDAIENMRDKFSVNEICDMFNMGKDTFYKIQNIAKEKDL